MIINELYNLNQNEFLIQSDHRVEQLADMACALLFTPRVTQIQRSKAIDFLVVLMITDLELQNKILLL